MHIPQKRVMSTEVEDDSKHFTLSSDDYLILGTEESNLVVPSDKIDFIQDGR
jgi:hypothetical protein